ncbi:MAG: 4Fe-4S dicluster domain-containing protein [Anaerolineaceae bacterium]|nr:MAG: 4Fe-4S dicluster domain-containing protein [Anaerolineaceae bacterium]
MSYDTIKSIIVALALLVALGIFVRYAWQRLWVYLRRGQTSPKFSDWGERIKGLIVFVGAQWRLFRFRLPGIAHFFIFWGFLLLSLTILQAIAEGLMAFANPQFVLPVIGTWGPLAFVQDFFALFVVIAIGYGLYLRLIVNPERYKGSHRNQGVKVLTFILTIMLSLLVMNGLRINLNEDLLGRYRPISTLIGGLFVGLPEATQSIIEELCYWIHLGVVMLFLTELPQGKHFHIVTSIPNVLLRNLEPRGRLPVTKTSDGAAGVSKMEDFRWRTMLDLYTCTECGRCQDVCPAYNSSGLLSPKLLVMNLRRNLQERGAALSAKQTNGVLSKSLTGEIVGEEALWNCTTCYACDQECPLFIEHINPIVEMRRYLVLEGKMDKMLQDALANLGRYGNSLGQSDRMRAKWTQGLQPAVKDARREPVEYLWFVGDYASYSPTLTDVTRKTAEVFSKAGLNFGILFDAERNSGNDVRRAGEEGLFEMLMGKNMQALGKCKYETIVTTDPHTYNTLKNEYAWDGNRPRILHYTELLDQLVASGQLKFSKKLAAKVTYHDPCYLGRYNGVYDAPRRLLRAAGCEVVEMPRHGDRAFCCGAGGGRIWMEEKPGHARPAEIRIREAAALTGVQSFVVACPKDVTMFKDAVKTTGNESRLQVQDLIEFVQEAI